MTAAARDASARPSVRGLLWPTIGTAVMLSLLIGLGLWQVQRLSWKNALVATIATRTTTTPVPMPLEGAWGSLHPDDYAYRHVTLTGTFENEKEARVFRPLDDPRSGPYSGLGDLILTPFRLDDGSVVIVNRGFVPDTRVDPASRAAGQTAGAVTITGLMREPETRNAFTPADQPEQRLWFTRDPQSIAAASGLDRVAPFSIDEDAAAVPGGLPQGGETVLSIPNNHLSYALTWFGLAAGLAAVYAVSVWRSRFSVRHAGEPDRVEATPNVLHGVD